MSEANSLFDDSYVSTVSTKVRDTKCSENTVIRSSSFEGLRFCKRRRRKDGGLEISKFLEPVSYAACDTEVIEAPMLNGVKYLFGQWTLDKWDVQQEQRPVRREHGLWLALSLPALKKM